MRSEAEIREELEALIDAKRRMKGVSFALRAKIEALRWVLAGDGGQA